MKVVIIGAGGHAQVVADILLQQQKSGEDIHPIGYIDENHELHGLTFLSLPVLGSFERLKKKHFDFDKVIIAIGNNHIRRKLAMKLESSGLSFATAIHPSAIVGSDVEIGPGTMVCANAVINTGSRVGRHVILNTAATIDHHSQVCSYAHLAPGVHTGGEVEINEGALLGLGSLVLPRKTIGQWATVGGGALVNLNVKDNETVVGIPARPIRR